MKFGRTSKQRLKNAHVDLQKIFELAIDRSKVDFSIVETYRSIARQQRLYKQGKTKIDGITRRSKHNHRPSLAVDIAVYTSDSKYKQKILYDIRHLSYIAGVVDSCAKELYEKKETEHLIRWGGDWNMNGVITHDQIFQDMPHFELIKP